MFMSRRQRYERLDTPEESRFDYIDPAPPSSDERASFLRSTLRPLPAKLNLRSSHLNLAFRLLTLSVGFLIAFGTGWQWALQTISGPTEQDLDKTCFEHTSVHSPLVEDIPIRWMNVTFDAGLFRRTIYREDASPAVDQAWWDLGIGISPTLIPQDRALRAGFTPGMTKAPPQNGTRYFAQFEVFHQLHCLDLLRKSNHFQWDYYARLGKLEWSNSEEVLREHVGHCVDLIRQQLMCTADVGVFGSFWWDGLEVPIQDFSTVHKCRNFDDVLDYAVDTMLPRYPWEFENRPRPGDEVRSRERGDEM